MKHIILDLEVREPYIQCLWDAGYLEALILQLVKDIKMRALMEPMMFEVPDGVTGFVVIATSHISIHGWPGCGKAHLDVFSCNDFDTKIVRRCVDGYLRPSRTRVTEVKRMEL